ncbi:MAG TPA: Rrf2 family transcriptional regulator [Gemmataceae bacterium]|nr:Rrf2 family transcriptional regulator [Gemmataceae bacterium]
MKLSRASSYALAALAHLAREKPDAPLASHDMAKAEGTPKRYLLKVLGSLADVGILRSLRGPGGGYRLARPAKDVTLLEVVEAVDGPIHGEAPDLGKEGVAALDKRLQAVCDEAAALVRQRLAKVTLAELAKGK